ncbi:ABC transporter permease [Janthinobacterium sp. PLB04]|uniref:ABC transporter permease n=1 Tax=Janthinobacterium lividum TaxID=29581 RepID=A0AAJ4T3V6_9BURK|nr:MULTISPECIES: ABC transporter permease [Janthinobacterium]KAB0325722.1 ABC transporter permease [Janthinobacterium lividum]QSX94835.1 ABC transporter permease [Janthinobacterium lividum]UGQ34649.1 ABC transporter permease [Janthinobacterium sp. PLB04]
MNASVRAGTGLLLVLALMLAGASWLQPASGGAMDAVLAPPGALHWLGTDDLGRDVLRRLAVAALPTLGIGVAVSATSIVLAVLLALCGLAWPAADTLVLRLADLFSALPSTLVFIVIASAMQPGVAALVAMLAAFGWDVEFRALRLRLRQVWRQESLDAARLASASGIYLLRRHVWPAMAGLLAVQAVALVRRAVFHYAGLAFLGLADPRTPTWGGMLNETMPYLAHPDARAWILAAWLCLAMLLIALALLGQGLDERARC